MRKRGMVGTGVVLVGSLLLLVGTALAACPDAVGTWTTLDGSLYPGRVSEAWCGADDNPVAPGQPGNTENAMSWDDAMLGTQWKAWGMSINDAGAVLINDTVDENGNGSRTYSTLYDGGEYWLDGSYGWTEGDVDLTGQILNYLVVTTVTYVGGNAVGQTSNVTFQGSFDDCPEGNDCVIEFAIANAILVWRSDSGLPMPADYPDFLCDATEGEFFQANDVTIVINCAVATENATWSSLKRMYR